MEALGKLVLKDHPELITKDFTAVDLDKLQAEGYYFRFQCLDWAPGEVSHGMIYDNPEEALEDSSTVLQGKSCVRSWRDLSDFSDSFDGSCFAVLVFTGNWVEYGHDGEDVVTPDKFVAAFDGVKFYEILNQEYDNFKASGKYRCFADYLEKYR